MSQPQEIKGDRPPSYLSKAKLAAELDMSESTVDSFVKRGVAAYANQAGRMRSMVLGGCDILPEPPGIQ